MDEIISKTLEVEAANEHAQTTEVVFRIDTWNIEVKARAIGLTSMGYDDEIGLWEELEHRNKPIDVSSM